MEKTSELPEKVDLFNYLAEEYTDVDLQKSIELSRRALKIAEKINYRTGIFYSFANLGTAYDDLGQTDSSYFYLDQAHVLAVDLEDDYALSLIKNNFGLYYLFQGNYTLALKYFQESLEGLGDPGYYIDPVVTYNNIGVIHEQQGNIEKAINYYQRAGEFALKNGDAPFAYLSFGYIDQLRMDFDQAIAYYNNALEIYKKNHDDLHIAETLFYIGECYLGKKEYEEARNWLHQSLTFYENLGMIPDVVEIYRTIALAYEGEGHNDIALELYHQAAEEAEASELPTVLVPVFKALAKQYALKNDYDKAYYYLLRYQALNDTIYDNETKERIAQLENSYELEVNKAEKQRLQAEQSEKETAVRQRTILATASTVVAILLSILAGVYYRANRQKQRLNKNLESMVQERTLELQAVNDKLRETNEELERYTYIASHDLKEPLRNITSFIELIGRRISQKDYSELEEFMGYVTRNTRQMYSLIEDVLNFSRITDLNMQEVEWQDLNAILFDVEATLRNVIRSKNATLEFAGLPSVKAHQSHVFMLFKNLIENGLKYNESERPCVQVEFVDEESNLRFYVRDNGIGIPAQYHDQIFEMFKRMNTRDKYEGTGIGLAICKKIVNKYGGNLTVESQEGMGSTFSFTWPK